MSSESRAGVQVEVRGVSKAYTMSGASAIIRRLRGKLLRNRADPTAPDAVSQRDWALRDVSFEVRRGEALAIVGRNGAGKTTILKILSRITTPTDGVVQVSRPVASMIELGAGFHPELTGRENIYLNGSILGMRRPQIRSRFDEIVEFADIGPYLDTPVKRYSSGMFVRLGFAVAAHVDAEVLLVDEVLAVGDVGFQRKCLGRLTELRKGGAAVIFVSHNLHLVQGLASHALLLDHGIVRARGRVGDVIARYVDSINAGTAVTAGDPRESATQDAIKVKSIGFLEANGIATDRVRSGDPLVVRISYSCGHDVPCCRVGFSLWTAEGVRIATLDTGIDGKDLSLRAGEGHVECRIPELFLLPDRYFIRGGIYDGETGWPIDRWGWEGGEVTSIVVSTSDRYSQSVVLTREHGIVHIPAEWFS
jgi:homopolymeric O-antigen transport system ATP-binding protein